MYWRINKWIVLPLSRMPASYDWKVKWNLSQHKNTHPATAVQSADCELMFPQGNLLGWGLFFLSFKSNAPAFSDPLSRRTLGGHSYLSVAVTFPVTLLLLVEHFKKTIKRENSSILHEWQTPRHQAVMSIDVPRTVWGCHRIRPSSNNDWPTNSWVFRINATNACSNSISLNPERRRPETKECPTNVPWSLMKHSTILSSCSSEIVQYPVTSCSSYSWTRSCSVHRETRNISAILVHVNPDEQNWRGTSSDIESFGQPTLPDFAVCEHPKRKLQAA